MAETPETNKLDFRNGFPIRYFRDGSMMSDQADGEESVLFANRPSWSEGLAVGKTVVSSSMIDRLSARLGRRLYEVRVALSGLSKVCSPAVWALAQTARARVESDQKMEDPRDARRISTAR